MASTSASAFALPPLPPGWTEHKGPGGHPYYFNSTTNTSTYTRPFPTFAPVAAPIISNTKKDKPLVKTPIPGTDWIRVRTTEGNTFYSHKIDKKSVWTVPEAIRGAVAALDAQNNTVPLEKEKKSKRKMEAPASQPVKRSRTEEDRNVEVVVITGAEHEEESSSEEEADEDETAERELWEKEAAAQLEAEAAAQKAKIDAEKKQREEEKREFEAKVKLVMPSQVDLSIDEAKALFKTLLREKGINPLHPWDKCLPLFVSDPRYVLLPSVAARRDAFDEFCRERARELRQEAVQTHVIEAEDLDPKTVFDKLLRDEVKSTRTSWTDFRRTWKKDRRFWNWGRDEREREKRFREYLKEVGETKRKAAERAESDFFALLKEHHVADGDWKEVKKPLVRDPRYDAVGSSSLREELYKTFIKGQASKATPEKEGEKLEDNEEAEMDEIEQARKKQERKERAVKEREAQVRQVSDRVQADISRSKKGLNQEEGERLFMTMLTDAIREPQTWEDAMPQLRIDPRFLNSPLPSNRQIQLFHTHIAHLRDKHMRNLHALLISHTPSLATKFSDLPLSSLLAAVPVARLGFDARALEHEFERWQRERTHEARAAFDQMLHDNSFVDFWGRLGKIGGEGIEGGVQAEDLGEDEGEFDGGKVDMKSLAKNIDVNAISQVLKSDKRYIVFDHVPEEREKWLRVSVYDLGITAI